MVEQNQNPAQNQNQNQNQLQVGIVRLYLKDLSFESPKAPQIFRANWRPEIKLDVNVKPRRIEGNFFEVSLGLTIEAKEGADIGFIVEIEQAGLFEMRGPEGPAFDRALRVFCPNILFPYARQAVDQALLLGGFPPLMLAPINFESSVPQDLPPNTAPTSLSPAQAAKKNDVN